MTPAELAKSNSEHGHQRALFAWANMAEQHGFEAAWDDNAYRGLRNYAVLPSTPVTELHWLHAIPNGGLRDKRTASMLKAEGVKRGIPDVSLPLPCWGTVANAALHSLRCIIYAGLYIEMKRPKSEEKGRAGTTSDEQTEVIAYLRHSGYAVSVCFTWDAAARDLQSYIEAVRNGLAR